MLAICAVIAVGFMVARGGEERSGPQATTRLVIGGLATGDGEPEVIAATVEPTRDIVEPTVQVPLTVQPSGNSGVFAPADIIALIVQYDWPDEDALRIAYCESRYDPFAVNPYSGAAGVFQFLDFWHHDKLAPGESWFDPAVNVRIAYQVWLDQGWQPWNVGGCW